MALTQEQWLERLKSFVPSWYFCQTNDSAALNEAIFQGMAKVLEKTELQLDDHFRETFICQSVDGYLGEHGSERNVERANNETTFSYQQRIKNIINTTSCPEIKRVVDALLDVGESIILEDVVDNTFYTRDSFYNRRNIMIDSIVNAFSIIVDNQVHEPYSFYTREFFHDREDFMGTNESSFLLFQLIVETVNRNKACGVVYRLIERAEEV